MVDDRTCVRSYDFQLFHGGQVGGRPSDWGANPCPLRWLRHCSNLVKANQILITNTKLLKCKHVVEVFVKLDPHDYA